MSLLLYSISCTVRNCSWRFTMTHRQFKNIDHFEIIFLFIYLEITDAPGMCVWRNLQRHEACTFAKACKSRRFAPVFSRELLQKLRFYKKATYFSYEVRSFRILIKNNHKTRNFFCARENSENN